MPPAIRFTVSFADFRFLQGYMTRRLFAKNRGVHVRVLMSIVFCALFITLAIVVNIHPGLALLILGMGYPASIYLAMILFLLAALLSLIPAILARAKLSRLQVSDDGPLLGETTLTVDDDGLTFDRKLMHARYEWAAFQGVEFAKNSVILPIDNGIGLIVPNAAWASDAARFEFAAFVQKKIESVRAA